jgi:adenine-specific DNA-methyltransferase
MNRTARADNLLAQLDSLNEQQLRRLLVEHLTKQKLGLYWEANAIERDAALNANVVLPRLVEAWSHMPSEEDRVGLATPGLNDVIPNLVIEGDNFDALRLLKATHAGKICVISSTRRTTPAIKTGCTTTAMSGPTTAGGIRNGWNSFTAA